MEKCPHCAHQWIPRGFTSMCPQCKRKLPVEQILRIDRNIQECNCNRCGRKWYVYSNGKLPNCCPGCYCRLWMFPGVMEKSQKEGQFIRLYPIPGIAGVILRFGDTDTLRRILTFEEYQIKIKRKYSNLLYFMGEPSNENKEKMLDILCTHA